MDEAEVLGKIQMSAADKIITHVEHKGNNKHRAIFQRERQSS